MEPEQIFKNKRLNEKKLLAFGFTESPGGYFYSARLSRENLELNVSVTKSGEVNAVITDPAFGEEYVLHKVPGAGGDFVGKVRQEYEDILLKISAECFEDEVFKGEQSKRVISYIREKYQNELEFLWEKFADNAIWRRSDNAKWYGLLLTVKRDRLGLSGGGTAEIIDLRANSDEIEAITEKAGFFPGYHMNKKHWITVLLDGTVPDDEIFRRIDSSFLLAAKK